DSVQVDEFLNQVFCRKLGRAVWRSVQMCRKAFGNSIRRLARYSLIRCQSEPSWRFQQFKVSSSDKARAADHQTFHECLRMTLWRFYTGTAESDRVCRTTVPASAARTPSRVDATGTSPTVPAI